MLSDPSTRTGAIRRLATARLISLAGSDASSIAIAFSLYAQTHSAAWLAAGLLLNLGVSSLLAPFGGSLADRYDRRRLMIGSELVAAVCLGSLVFIHTPVALLALSALATSAGCAFGPAAGAAIPALAGPEELSWANSMLAVGANIGKTAGRLGGGVLVALAGSGAVFSVDAVTFLISALLTCTVRLPFGEAPANDGHPATFRRLSLRQALTHPTLRLVTASGCVATFMTAFTMVAELPLVHRLGGGAAALGALTACWSVGMIIGSWWAGRSLDEESEPRALLSGRLLMGAGIGTVALAPVIAPALASYLLGGAAGGFLLVASSSMLQRSALDEVRGRALAVAEGAKTAAFAAGTLVAGAVVGFANPQTVYLMVGAGVIASAVPAWRLARAGGVAPPLGPAPTTA